MKQAAFSINGVNAEVGGRLVLRNVDIQLRSGQWTSVVGPNGAGKSTLLKTIAGLLPAVGHIEWHGKPLQSWTRRERARALSWLGQNETAADDLTVYDVAMLGRIPHQDWLAPANQADHNAVQHALKKTQAWDWRKRALGGLSGGERQRVLLARALAVDAQILLMDEPLANLDPPHQSDWMRIVRELTNEGRTVVSVLHEISIALHADDMVVMSDGKVIHHGLTDDSNTHHVLEDVFEHRVAIHAIAGQWVALPVY